MPDAYNPQDWDRYSYTRNNPSRFTDPTGHYACGDGIYDKRCDKNQKGQYIGLSEDDAAILTTIMAFESTSGAVPDDVTYMKAWALLNLRSYNLKCGSPCKAPGVPFGDWRYHERVLLNGLGITGTYDEQINEILVWYKDYKAGKKSLISSERFAGIETSTEEAIYDWYNYGTNSLVDPVKGSTGFIDASGLRYPNGRGDEPYLGEIANYEPLMTDVVAMEHLQDVYSQTGVVSPLYPFTILPTTGQKMYTFTWFN